MLNRHIDSIIERHYATTNKALLLTGARQTGKTYAIRRYAKQDGLQLMFEELHRLGMPDESTPGFSMKNFRSYFNVND